MFRKSCRPQCPQGYDRRHVVQWCRAYTQMHTHTNRTVSRYSDTQRMYGTEVFTHACTYACVFVCTQACVFVCTHVCMSVCAYSTLLPHTVLCPTYHAVTAKEKGDPCPLQGLSCAILPNKKHETTDSKELNSIRTQTGSPERWVCPSGACYRFIPLEMSCAYCLICHLFPHNR